MTIKINELTEIVIEKIIDKTENINKLNIERLIK